MTPNSGQVGFCHFPPSSGSVLFELAKVIVIKIKIVKIHRCGWFSGVAAYFIRFVMACVCVCMRACMRVGELFSMKLRVRKAGIFH